jgi:pilus assembly protein CpaD
MKSFCCLIAAMLVSTTGACGFGEKNQQPPADAASYDYREKHPIVVEPSVAVLQLSTQTGTIGADDARHLDAFGSEFLRRGSGVVEISVGAISPQDAGARAYAQRIARRLIDDGLRPSEVRLQLVVNAPAIDPGTAFLRYNTTTVQLPECYDWSSGPRNAPLPNFGCSVQRNVGAMIANPRDLSEPQPMDGPTGRQADVIDKLNQGAVPWTSQLPWSAQSSAEGK